MLSAAVVGIQFGDEGKGKVVDFLSDRFDVVVRFNGGSNAGHTVVVGDRNFKFHLLPSGALRCSSVVLGNGTVINPKTLLDEIKMVREINPGIKVYVSNRAHVVTPLHKVLDKKEEEVRGPSKIGTTFEGIGPAYEDKYARTGIRIEDLLSLDRIREKLDLISRMKESLLGNDMPSGHDIEDISTELYRQGKELSPYISSTESVVNSAHEEGRNILFEGANGTLLDIDFGIFPFVTSSNTVAGFLSCGAGFSFRKVRTVIGVIKAYTSKVGAGPFPTEISGEAAERLRELGHEYGTTTGRPRRVGWLDIPALKYTIRMSDIDTLAVTNIDTLGQMDEIKIGLNYVHPGSEGEIYHPETGHVNNLEGLEVNFRNVKPWGILDDGTKKEIIENGPSAFPKELMEYLRIIEEKTGRKIGIVSFGRVRENTIIMDGLELPEAGK